MLPVTGLYGHAQRNVLKSILLLAVFIALQELLQIVIGLHQASSAVVTCDSAQFQVSSHLSRQLGAPTSDRVGRSTGSGSERGAGLPTFDQISRDLKGAPKSGGPVGEGTDPPRAATSGSKPASALPPCARGLEVIPAAWAIFVRHSTFFSTGWLYAIGIGLGWVALSCWWSGFLVRYQTGARGLDRRDAPELYDMVENLAITAGLPCPRIEIIDSDALNAYASGFTVGHASVAVTRGLLEVLTRDELETVLAHEVSHIRTRDVRLMVIAKACADVVMVFGKLIVENAVKHPILMLLVVLMLVRSTGPLTVGLLVAVLLAMALAGVLFKAMISRARELVADAGAIELTRNPVALITALRKISRNDALPGLDPFTRAMMFSQSAEAWLSTHPPVDERIAAIKRYAGVGEHEIPCASVARRHGQGTSDPQGGRTFGRRRGSRGLPGTSPVGDRAAGGLAHIGVQTAPPSEPGKQDWVQRWVLSGFIDDVAKGFLKVVLVVQLVPVLIFPILLIMLAVAAASAGVLGFFF